MIKIILFITFVTVSTQANEESVFAEIARLRQYPSGADECDLKVKSTLNQSTAKKKKQIKTEPTEGF